MFFTCASQPRLGFLDLARFFCLFVAAESVLPVSACPGSVPLCVCAGLCISAAQEVMAAVWSCSGHVDVRQCPHKTLPQEREGVLTFLRASSEDKIYREQTKIHLDQHQMLKHIPTFPDKGTAA